MFIAPPGRVIICCDYNQMELRMIAHYTQDPAMLEAYQSGSDLHEMTMERVGCERYIAKPLNFGLMYGTYVPKLAMMLECSEAEAQGYYDAFFDTYAQIKPFAKSLCNHVRRKGYLTLLAKRRRRVRNLNAEKNSLRNRAERQVFNTLIQGGCADIMKRSLMTIESSNALKEYGAELLLTVHDEVVLECDQRYALQAGEVVVRLMENHPFKLTIPMLADVGIGSSWGTAKP